MLEYQWLSEKNGVEKIEEIELSSEEKKQFNLSIKAVKDLLVKSREIDPKLSN